MVDPLTKEETIDMSNGIENSVSQDSSHSLKKAGHGKSKIDEDDALSQVSDDISVQPPRPKRSMIAFGDWYRP